MKLIPGILKDNAAVRAKLDNHARIVEENWIAEVDETSAPVAPKESTVPMEHIIKPLVRLSTSLNPRYRIKDAQGFQDLNIEPTTNINQGSLPQRTASLPSPKRSINQGYANATGSSTPQTRPKTSTRTSPGFSLNRNSLREPFSRLSKKFPRNGIKGLFPTTPKKNYGLSRQANMTNETISNLPSAHDSGYENFSTRVANVDDEKETYHTARFGTVPSDEHSKESSGESDQIYHDAQEIAATPKTPEVAEPVVASPPVTPVNTPAHIDPAMIPIYPIRSSSLPMIEFSDEAPPVPPKSAKRMSRMDMNFASELHKTKAPSIFVPSIDAMVGEPRVKGVVKESVKISRDPITLGELIRAQLSLNISAQDKMQHSITTPIAVNDDAEKETGFKSTKPNWFPRWAAECRADGQPKYTQKQIFAKLSEKYMVN